MRHEVPILVPDPFLYVERDGARHTVSTVVRGRPDRGDSRRAAGACVRGVRLRRPDRAGPAARGGRPRSRRQRLQGARRREGGRPADVPDRGRRAALAVRDPGDERPRDLRRPAAGEERGGARRDPARAARGRGRDGRRARPAAAGRAERLRPRRRRRAADGGADQGRDQRGVRRAPRGRRGLHRRARGAGRGRARPRVGADRRRAVGRDRPLAEGPGDGLLRGHDPHLRRRRAAGGARRVPPAREGGARPCARDHAGGDPGDGAVPGGLRPVPGGGLPDAALEGAGRGADERLLPRARPRGRARGARAAVAGAGAGRHGRRRRRHARAGALPAGLRRRPARGSRPRHRERRGEPDRSYSVPT